MNTGAVRRLVTLAIWVPIVSTLGVACSGGSTQVAAECIKVVAESGEKTNDCLPVAPDGERVDLGSPTFSHPTPITNPLHPTSGVQQIIYGGHVDGKPFRTEVTLLPETKATPYRGATVDTALIQYVAYLDGRLQEVAIDRYAQADDGSVWYFGEDYSAYEDGKVTDTEGTWVVDDKIPAALIMPAQPRVGNVYRPENVPEVVFEEVRVEKVDMNIASPSGNISGAMEVNELHMDGTREGKTFAPGYGEFSTGEPGGDLEAVSLASPTDRRPDPAPAEFGALSTAARGVFEAVAASDAERAKQAAAALNQAWGAVLAKGIPPQMQPQMKRDIGELTTATDVRGWGAAQSAALRIAQNELDLRLLYQPVIDVDRGRLALWADQLPVDVTADDTGAVLGDVAALEQVWKRTRPGVEQAAAMDSALQELRRAGDDEDLSAVLRAAATLVEAVRGLHAR
ncbi:hypothetical protein [Mycolicibacterium sp.]|uniref:hypothetical protein n=1 Tax=Mycolicibacterium sp. TaxID=2320850 RepID=UPI0025CE78BB|nr:hypothetical protein [Mycolicibacterium sp.]